MSTARISSKGQAHALADRTAAHPPDLQLLIDSAPALIHTSLPDGHLDFFNETWLRYIGGSLHDVQGWKWTNYIHPDDVEGIVRKLARFTR